MIAVQGRLHQLRNLGKHLLLARARPKHAIERKGVLATVDGKRQRRAARQAADGAVGVGPHAAKHADLRAVSGCCARVNCACAWAPSPASEARKPQGRLHGPWLKQRDPPHVASELHQLVVQPPPRRLGLSGGDLQR